MASAQRAYDQTFKERLSAFQRKLSTVQPLPFPVDGGSPIIDSGSDDETAPAGIEIAEESLDSFYSDIAPEADQLQATASIDALFQRPTLPPPALSGSGPDNDVESESLP